tara:strand:+ start:4168 stop:4953 length:786 start_codon:yes stop_codon:yes gene_type:complete
MDFDEDTKKYSFLGEGVSYWIGKLVSTENGSQRTLMGGGSWGYRYRVRMLADYSNKDTVEDNDVFVAQALIPLTAGTGAAERSESINLSQGDMVLGIFLGPDRTAPFILHAFTRGTEVENDGSKFGIESGFTKKVKPGLLEGQESSQTASATYPELKQNSNKGNGKGKGAPVGQLGKLKGGLDEENAVGAFGKLSGNTGSSGLTLQELRQRTAERNASEGNRVGDTVDISEERAFEASLDAEIERARAGDRSGLDEALELY